MGPFIDSHCHLDDVAFDVDRTAVLAAAAAAGVVALLVPGVRPAAWSRVCALRCTGQEGSPQVEIALGIHPQVAAALTVAERRQMPALADQIRAHRAVAVGECGLDGPSGQIDVQTAVFTEQIGVARDLGLPLILHVFRAHEEALRILRREKAHAVGGVVHSFSGSAALVPRYQDLGFAFSFAGPVGYPGARRPVEAARAVPLELLLAETDAPDQTPHSHRGQRNQPAHVGAVVRALAAARQEDPAAVAAATVANARRVFGLDRRDTTRSAGS